VPLGLARRGRHWQRWGLKHAVDAEKASRRRDQPRGMMGRGNESEASRLRIVTSAELKRLSGSRPKTGRGSGSADINGRPTHVSYPPVYRGALTPSVQCAKRGKPEALSGAVQRVSPRSRPKASAGEGGAGKGRGRKRRLSCNGADRSARVAPPERGLTSRGCDRTRSTRQTVNRGSVDHG
jgi:hypothetical protein